MTRRRKKGQRNHVRYVSYLQKVTGILPVATEISVLLILDNICADDWHQDSELWKLLVNLPVLMRSQTFSHWWGDYKHQCYWYLSSHVSPILNVLDFFWVPTMYKATCYKQIHLTKIKETWFSLFAMYLWCFSYHILPE